MLQGSPSLSQSFQSRRYFVALAILTLGGPPAFGEENHLEPLVRAWTLRQERTTSLKARVSIRQVVGALSRWEPSLNGSRSHIPEMQTTLDGSERFLLRDRNLRYERTIPQWSPRQNGFVEQQSTFSVGKQLELAGVVRFPRGWIHPHTSPKTTRQSSLAALRWAYRPFDTNLGGVYVPDLRATDRRETLEDRQLAVFMCTRLGTSRSDAEIWVDSESDFLPVRFLNMRDGERRLQIDISYRDNMDGLPLVSGWTITTFGPGERLRESIEATVTELSLNGPTDEAEFDLEFPAGTWVNDQRSDEQYIVKANGEKRLIRPEELSYDNYQRLLKTKTGEAPIRRAPEPENNRAKPRLPQA